MTCSAAERKKLEEEIATLTDIYNRAKHLFLDSAAWMNFWQHRMFGRKYPCDETREGIDYDLDLLEQDRDTMMWALECIEELKGGDLDGF